VQTIAAMIDTLHESQIPVDPESQALLLTAMGQISWVLAFWRTGNRNLSLPEIPGLRDKSPIAVIREFLDKCTDTIIPSELAGLDFVKDPDYRQILREEFADFESDLNNKAWKSATVLGGSLIEALLLDTLESEPKALTAKSAQRKKGKVLPLKDWTLAGCIPTAKELGIIDKETATLADHARDFRNHIHPGKALRTQKRCSESTAHVVKGALLAVIEDLEKWSP
jgi:hypothetical protein